MCACKKESIASHRIAVFTAVNTQIERKNTNNHSKLQTKNKRTHIEMVSFISFCAKRNCKITA